MGNSYQFNKKAILHPHSVSPLVSTPATTSAWGWQLHRRVQLHGHQICGNVFERSVEDAQLVLPHSPKRLTAQVARSEAEGRGQ